MHWWDKTAHGGIYIMYKIGNAGVMHEKTAVGDGA